jgi:uncharacterized protein (TIGR03435 family)
MFEPTGIFGSVTAHLKAGDLAPDLVFTKILNASSAAPWRSANLSGQMTVLAFFPDTSHNLQSVSRWNALVDQFADKPVQFVWIIGEKESSLLPWLQKHPIKGWVFHDPLGATGRSYGLEDLSAAIIGNDRRIVGFDQMIVPDSDTINAALQGRRSENLDAEPLRMPRADEHKPDFPPSYTLHISPAKDETRGDFSNGTFHSFRGPTLKVVISQLYEINTIRIHLPPALDDDKRYDFALVLPEPESQESMNNRIRQGIEDHFRVKVTREERLLDVYIVAAPNGNPPEKARLEDPEKTSGIKMGSVQVQAPKAAAKPHQFVGFPKAVGISAIRGISVDGTVDDLCRTLEIALDRPVVNETNLQGDFAFCVKASDGPENDFLERLRDELNLTITPAQRSIEIVVLEPR